MTVDSLIHRLQQLQQQGAGAHEIAIQRVDGGVTFKEPVMMVTEGDPADGEIAWLITGDVEAPEWFPNA